MDLSDATWTEAEGVDTDLALLPVGSTEQHGPHLPLGTDTFAATAVAETGADAYDGDVVVAPPIPVGVAAEHRSFPGTLWVSPDTFRSYVRETVTSLAAHGFDRVVVVNGHGGNTAPLREVCARVTRESAAYAVPFTWFEAVDPPTEMGHGGPIETALLRAVRGDLVREDRIEAARSGGSDRWGEWVAGVNLSYDVEEFSANGVVGDPDGDADGDADEGIDGGTDGGTDGLGDRLLEEAGGALRELLESVAAREPSEDGSED